jgi:type VI secretion system protein VasG
VQRVREMRTKLEKRRGAAAPRRPPAATRGAARRAGPLNAELAALQGETPLIPVCVDAELVGQVISGWTGIPVGKMLRDDLGMALELEKHLGAGHRAGPRARDHQPPDPHLQGGHRGPAQADRRLPAGRPQRRRQDGDRARLSDLLYGGEHNVITINMSEFQEAHTVSTLKGSPPGYVGYGEGGVLTEAVRRRPYSVVLLDEIEKAHPDVLELFFQVFDKGAWRTARGREIDFKNCIIILTTNAGTDTIMKLTADPETMPSHEGLVKALKPELDKTSSRPSSAARWSSSPTSRCATRR